MTKSTIPNATDWLPIDQIAARTGNSVFTVYSWRRLKGFPEGIEHKFDRFVYWHWPSVEAWCRSRINKHGSARYALRMLDAADGI